MVTKEIRRDGMLKNIRGSRAPNILGGKRIMDTGARKIDKTPRDDIPNIFRGWGWVGGGGGLSAIRKIGESRPMIFVAIT